MVDVYPLRRGGRGIEMLALRRAPGGRCPGAWEAVHGHLEAGETPVAAALRELREETGLAAGRLYNLSRVESFYLHRTGEVVLVPAFALFVRAPGVIRLSAEHDTHEWLTLAEARDRFAWPRERRAAADIGILFGSGDAGPLEDVLRVE